MKVRRTDRFKKDYQKLPLDIQQRVDQKLRFLLRDPRHPSLRVHKVRSVEGLWEFRPGKVDDGPGRYWGEAGAG